MSNVIKGIFIITVVAFFAVSSTGSYFSDTVKVQGNEFSAGTWEIVTTTIPTTTTTTILPQ